jgi:hypothetical protein
MPAYVIPTDTGPETQPQVLRVTLDGAVFQLYLRYNSRAGMWRMDVQDDAGTTLAAGLSMRNAGLPANGCIANLEGLPAGLLLAQPVTDASTDADLEELGGRVLLVYQQIEAV